MAFTIIITNAGRAALVNAENSGTNSVIISEIGFTPTYFSPGATRTSVPGETHRIAAVSGTVVENDRIHLTVRDESSASYSVRGFGLYLSDGTLFAVYGQTATILEKSAQAMLLLAVDIKFADVNAATINFGSTSFSNPTASETVRGVIEIATQAEANAGNDLQRALTPRKGRDAVLPWLLTKDGSGSGLDADLLDGKHAAAFLELVNFTGAAVLAKLLSADGAGSGLDADLLDGQQGSYYADIIARLGFTPLNSTAFTGAAVLSRLLTVDGAGSGLDADLLDGQHGSYYANIPARLGFTPLNATAYTAADVLAKLLTQDGGGSGLDADLLDGQQGSYYSNVVARLGYTPLNSTAYTAADVLLKLLSVDGAGSGIDADLLDGFHADDFLQLSNFTGSNQSKSTATFQKLPGGLIIQGGTVSASGNADTTVTWPLAFPGRCVAAVVSAGDSDRGRQDNPPAFRTWNLANGSVSNGVDVMLQGRWIAIGY